jgi:hypothetical protein
MVLVQPSRGTYPAPPHAYRGQDLGWLAHGLPHVAGANGTALVPTVRLHLHTLHDVRFCVGHGLDGVVLTADGMAVQEMAMFSEQGRARAAQVTHNLPEADETLDDVFIGFDAAWGNWFHFLCFALGRSALAASVLPPGCRIVLPDLASRPVSSLRFSAETWRQALEAFGLGGRNVLKLPPGIYRARTLRFFWSEPEPPNDITYMAEFQRVFTSVRRGLRRRPDLPRRLLVARNRPADPRLEPAETDLLHRIAAEHGFVPVHFEAMDFRSQAEAMFNAEAVIGVHGAGLANLLFGRASLRVLEINRSIGREPLPRPWFYLMAMARKQRYLALNRDAGDLDAARLHSAIDILLGFPGTSHQTHVAAAPIPAGSRGPVVLATVCNTVPSAAPFALWLERGSEQVVVDLATVLDQPGDTGLTGLAWHAGQLYVAVQSTQQARIVVLDRQLAPVRTITDPRFVDLHSITTVADGLLIAATGNGMVLHYRFADGAIETLCTLGSAAHLNAACRDGADLLVCCQSVARITPQSDAAAPRGGGVFSMAERRVLVGDLSFPHSVMPVNDGFVVLDSARSRVLRFDRDGIRQERVLEGFLRGICILGDRLFVSSGPQRLVSRSTGQIRHERTLREALAEQVVLHELDAATLDRRTRRPISVAGFELYEVLALPPDALDPPPERTLAADPTAFARLFFNAFISLRTKRC